MDLFLVIQYFIDFGTGTTVDDIYGVNGVSHAFTPGDFTTTVKFVPMRKFGQYQSLIGNLSKIAAEIRSLDPNAEAEPEPGTGSGSGRRRVREETGFGLI